MSRNISKSRKSVNRISYCKVCHDAGKTEKEYRSHSTKDEKNNIICPTLLSLECRYCYKAGHTIKYCPSNKSKHKYEKKIEILSQKGKLYQTGFLTKDQLRQMYFLIAIVKFWIIVKR